MENKNVGWLIVGISIVMTAIVLIFNSTLKSFAGQTCGHESCAMYDTMNIQMWISLSIVAIIFIIGVVIMKTKPKEKIVVKTIREKKKKLDLKGIDKDERKVVDLLSTENNAMFQSDLMEKLGIGKVKTTRLLDKLESKGIIERKRRGMNNIVVLRY